MDSSCRWFWAMVPAVATSFFLASCTDECERASDCAVGEICYVGICTPANANYLGCTSDTECNPSGGDELFCNPAGRCSLKESTTNNSNNNNSNNNNSTPNVSWGIRPSPVTTQLTGVWGSTSTVVWAVGPGDRPDFGSTDPTTGTLIRWNGSAWSGDNIPQGTRPVAVWGSAANDAWIVGRAGTLLRYDGRSWQGHPSPISVDFDDVYGSSANNVWAVGEGRIMRFSNAWQEVQGPQNIGREPMSVWTSGPNDVWVVANTTAHHWNGSTWDRSDPFVGSDYFTIFGFASDEVFVGGVHSAVPPSHFMRFDGSNWTALPDSGRGGEIHGIWGLSVDEIWVGGQLGVVQRWEKADRIATCAMNGVGKTGPGLCTEAVGVFGDSSMVREMWGFGSSDIWVVGDNGKIAHKP